MLAASEELNVVSSVSRDLLPLKVHVIQWLTHSLPVILCRYSLLQQLNPAIFTAGTCLSMRIHYGHLEFFVQISDSYS